MNDAISTFLFQTDRIPTEDPHRPQYKWMSEYSENLSGTPGLMHFSILHFFSLQIKEINNDLILHFRSIRAILNGQAKNRSLATSKKVKLI